MPTAWGYQVPGMCVQSLVSIWPLAGALGKPGSPLVETSMLHARKERSRTPQLPAKSLLLQLWFCPLRTFRAAHRVLHGPNKTTKPPSLQCPCIAIKAA